MKHDFPESSPSIDWTRLAEYLPPDEYRRLLPRYAAGGLSDLDIFRRYLVRAFSKRAQKPLTALELGPGTGRATEVFLETIPDSRLSGVDLSRRMISFLTGRFPAGPSVSWIVSDSIAFLQSTGKRFDLIYSLWSFSHAMHRCLAVEGMARGKPIVEKALQALLARALNKDGHLYIIHFDSCSDEQTISLRQRRRVWPFLEQGAPSPSQQIFEAFFNKAASDGRCQFRRKHYVGDEIPLGSVAFARKVYLKFHMEDVFGPVKIGDPVYDELTADLLAHRRGDGLVVVKPAWYEYSIVKL